MTKRELVIEVATRLGYTQSEVSDVVQKTLDCIVEALAAGERLEIRNFGVFEVKTRDARIGRNPRTGEEVPISSKRVPAFKPGKTLKQWVQDGPGTEHSGLFDGETDDLLPHGKATAAPPKPNPDSSGAGRTSL